MMMNFRRVAVRFGALVVCSAALCAVPMKAQGGGGMSPQERQAAQLDALTKAVGLTPDQVTQVKAINEDAMKKQMDVRNSGGDPADMRPKMMAIREEQQTKIKALLTDDQKPKYDEFLASQPRGGRGGRGGGGGGGNGAPPPPPPSV